jgi:capsular exopolysaccharide synthesis family protein
MQKFNNNLSLKLKTEKLRLKDIENNFYAEVESIKNATPPDSYFSPNTTLYIFLGGFLGLIAGIFVAFFSNSNKIDLIKTTEDLEESGYKIIAQIPSFPEGSSLLFDSLSKTEKDKVDQKIYNAFDGISIFLKYGSLDKPLKTILVASGQDSEGKSVVASNVAIALANGDNKVLLVDADLKHPQLNKYFKMKSTPSLAHYLFRKKELDEIIRTTHNTNLDIITCIEFPQNPAVIITSERMKNFMSEVVKDYDYVVYDTCSLCTLKETAEIAKEMDEVILVVRANQSKILEFVNAENLLKENGVNNVNVVLNDVKV